MTSKSNIVWVFRNGDRVEIHLNNTMELDFDAKLAASWRKWHLELSITEKAPPA